MADSRSSVRAEMPTFEEVRQFARTLPGIEEGTSYGTPAFRVRGRFLGRLHDDDERLVLKIDLAEREALLQMQPSTFTVTPHYEPYPLVLIRLETVDPLELRELITEAWRREAPKRLVADFDG
jgi:hypothetical protein